MPAFHLTTSVRDGVVTVAVGGELDVASRELVRAHLFELMDTLPSPAEIFLDLGELTFVDAAGLGVLVAVHQRAGLRGARLTLTDVPPRAAQLMRITGLDEHFRVAVREET